MHTLYNNSLWLWIDQTQPGEPFQKRMWKSEAEKFRDIQSCNKQETEYSQQPEWAWKQIPNSKEEP